MLCTVMFVVNMMGTIVGRACCGVAISTCLQWRITGEGVLHKGCFDRSRTAQTSGVRQSEAGRALLKLQKADYECFGIYLHMPLQRGDLIINDFQTWMKQKWVSGYQHVPKLWLSSAISGTMSLISWDAIMSFV